jgi:hypothetical protein
MTDMKNCNPVNPALDMGIPSPQVPEPSDPTETEVRFEDPTLQLPQPELTKIQLSDTSERIPFH